MTAFHKFLTALVFSSSTIVMSQASFADSCDVRLDQRVVDGSFGWWGRGNVNTVVTFKRIGEGQYKVNGLYVLNDRGRYELLKKYWWEGPTYSGNGQTARINEVKFFKNRYVAGICSVEFSGPKSDAPHEREIYKADYEKKQKNLLIHWPESEDVLKFSNVPRNRIEE